MPSRSQTSGTRERLPAGIFASMKSSLSFFCAGSPNGRKRSPGRRLRTASGGLRLRKSSATRSGSAPKARGSNPAGVLRRRAVRVSPHGRATRPGTCRAIGRPRGSRAAAPAVARASTRPAPSLRQLTPPGRSHERAPVPGAMSASTCRLEKSAGVRATSRRASSSARDSTAGCVAASSSPLKAYRRAPAAATPRTRVESVSMKSASRRSCSASVQSRSTIRGL